MREDAELTLLCVPDTSIADMARGLTPGHGLWVAHVSGATPLSALDPHERRFSLHPLQTFTRTRGPEQLDGAWAAVTAESDEARELGFELARRARAQAVRARRRRPPALPRGRSGRVELPGHAARGGRCPRRSRGSTARGVGAADASHDRERLRADRADRRGDWATVEAHRGRSARVRPDLEPLYDVLAEATAK